MFPLCLHFYVVQQGVPVPESPGSCHPTDWAPFPAEQLWKPLHVSMPSSHIQRAATHFWVCPVPGVGMQKKAKSTFLFSYMAVNIFAHSGQFFFSFSVIEILCVIYLVLIMPLGDPNFCPPFLFKIHVLTVWSHGFNSLSPTGGFSYLNSQSEATISILQSNFILSTVGLDLCFLSGNYHLKHDFLFVP